MCPSTLVLEYLPPEVLLLLLLILVSSLFPNSPNSTHQLIEPEQFQTVGLLEGEQEHFQAGDVSGPGLRNTALDFKP